MKKLFLLICLVFLFSINVSVQAENICEVDVSPYKVVLNGRIYREKGGYPALFYNNVVYIPMTYDIGEAVGRTIEWVDGYEQNVLLLTEKESEHIIVKNTINENEIKSQTVIAEIADCTVAICMKENLNLIRGTAKYPLLRYKDIIYIPLTWKNIVGNFGWSYTFDEVNGVNIDTSQSNISEKNEKDIYISEDGSTTCYLLERRKKTVKLTDDYAEEKTDYIGLIRFNHDMKGKDLTCYNMSEFIIERELSQPVKQGDIRFFKSYSNDKEFFRR